MTQDGYYAPDFRVKVQGLTLSAEVRNAVIELTYESSLETAEMFSFTLNNADLRFTDSALFDVGKEVEIYMGYAGQLEPMMLGEITAIQPSFPQGGAPTLSVMGYDRSHRMRHNKPARSAFQHMSDSAIAAQIAAENGLIPVVDPCPRLPRASVQQTASDWALLKGMADRNYFEFYVRWDKLYFRFPRPQTEMVTLEWGKNLSSFNPRLSTSGQVGTQVVRGYDHKLAQTIVAVLPALSLGADLDDIVERLGSAFVDQLAEIGRNVIRDQPVDSFADANLLASSMLKQILDGLYEGSGACIGMPQLRAGDQVRITGVGKRFSGKYRLSEVTHSINSGGYQTSFQVTQQHNGNLLSSLRRHSDEESDPDGQPTINGAVIGIVQNNMDPKGMGRVQLWFPHLSDKNLSAWARVATLLAGGNDTTAWGSYFVPEQGDEVLVVFEQGDIDRPIVIGSLWNGRRLPPADAVDREQNTRKVIKTRSGHTIMFDDTPETGGVNINEGDRGAARKEDRVRSTVEEDEDFWRWLVGFVSVFNTWAPPATPDGGAALKSLLTTFFGATRVPSQLTGKIIEGSDSVKIGD